MNGIIVVNKPQNFTSFDAVAIMRGCFKTKKVGHSGTLDPMATGVLPIFIGSATKAVSVLPESGKSYRAGFRLGLTSDTLDIWGKCSKQNDVHISYDDMTAVLEYFRGEIEQIPPMYSALKVNGKKLCDLARNGIEVERKPRKITISRLELVEFDGQNGIIEVDCSSGTYIRSLCDDFGAKLQTGAVMTGLVRTMACGFSIEESYSIEELKTKSIRELEQLLKPTESVFGDYSEIHLDDIQTRMYLNGVRLDAKRLNGDVCEGGVYRIYGGGFIGIAVVKADELVSIKRMDANL